MFFRVTKTGHAVKLCSFYKSWRRACVLCGLGVWEPVTDKAGKPVFVKLRSPRSKPKVKVVYRGLIFHDLRRSAIRHLIRAQVPQSVAMDISGHRGVSVFKRYNITSEQDVREAGKKLALLYEKEAAGSTSTSNGDIPGDSQSIN